MATRKKNKMSPLINELKQKKTIKRLHMLASKKQRLHIEYQKKNGDIVKRIVSSYEVKPHRTSGRMMLYVTDDKHGDNQILSFHLSGVRKVRPLINDSATPEIQERLKGFEPRWPVQFEKKKRKRRR